MRATTLFAASTVLLVGCAPKLLRHYESIEPGTAPPNVELSVFLANPRASDPSPVLSSLGERGQAELIRSLAARMPATSGPEDLLALLQRAPEEPPKTCAWASKKSATKKLVLTVLGDLHLPADRLDKLDMTFTLDTADGSDKRASFVSWDHFESVYGKFDIGTAKYTQSGKLSAGRTGTDVANLPASAGSVTKVFSLGAEATNTLEESASYALRRMSIGGALTPLSAQFVQEGGPNINLFGSSVATLSLSLKTLDDPIGLYSFVLKKQSAVLTPDQVTVERCRADYPISSAPITVNVTAKALLRLVTLGDGTVSEGDDAVTLKSMTLTPKPSAVTLLTKSDLKLERYALAYCSRAQQLADCTRLHIEFNGVQNKTVEQILMPSMDAAVKLRGWLVDQTKASMLSAINGLAIGLAPKEAASSIAASQLAGLQTREASQLRVVLLPDSE